MHPRRSTEGYSQEAVWIRRIWRRGHYHNNILGTGNQIHGTAHALTILPGIIHEAMLPFTSTSMRQVQSDPHDRHGSWRMIAPIENCRAFPRGNGLFTGINHAASSSSSVGNAPIPSKPFSDATSHPSRQECSLPPGSGYQCEIDVIAIAQFAGDSHRHLFRVNMVRLLCG